MVGDRVVDLQAGIAAGVAVAFIGTEAPSVTAKFWGKDLSQFVQYLVQSEGA